MTWAEFSESHPLSLYRDREWLAWQRKLAQARGVARSCGWDIQLANPVPNMKRLEGMPIGKRDKWMVVWEVQRETEYREQEGLLSIKDERRFLEQRPDIHDEEWEYQPDYSIHAPWNRE